ncbi:cation diffusion facilitator family transporter [Fervidobacterium sp.]
MNGKEKISAKYENIHSPHEKHGKNEHHNIHNHHEHHSHKQYEELSITQFTAVVLLNLGITIAEFVGGLIAGSLALMSDAAHNFSDSFSLIISYVAHRISSKSVSLKKTFGYKRANILAALINSFTLMLIGGWLIVEAIHRIISPVSIDTEIVLVVGFIGLLANLISMLILKKWTKENLNLSSAYLHMLMDAFSSIAVITGAVLIRLFNVTFLDPMITIFIAIYVIKEAFEILNRSISILMQGVPREIDVETVVAHIRKNPAVANVHHVHLWSLDEKNIFLEAHVNLNEDVKLSDSMEIYKAISCELSNIGIEHVTIQFEYQGCADRGIIGC